MGDPSPARHIDLTAAQGNTFWVLRYNTGMDDRSSLQAALSGLPLGEIRWFESIGSTNDEALAWASAGAPNGSLVAADRQTRGRGRLGRSWETHPGAALAVSLILRPAVDEMEYFGLFSPLGGLAVCQALESEYSLPAEIKWPNDVLVGRRKVCGVLAEAGWDGSALDSMVIGIGINVAPGSVPPAGQLNFPATCVEEALGRPVDRWRLLAAVVAQMIQLRPRLGSLQFLKAWEERLAYRGELVRLENSGGQPVNGTLLGVTSEGSLRLAREDGSEVHFSAGDVSLRPAGERQT